MSNDNLNKSLAMNADRYESFIESAFCAIIARHAEELATAAREAILHQAQNASIDVQKSAYYGARLTLLEELQNGSFWRAAYNRANARLCAQSTSSAKTREHYNQAIDPRNSPVGASRGDALGPDEEWSLGAGDE